MIFYTIVSKFQNTQQLTESTKRNAHDFQSLQKTERLHTRMLSNFIAQCFVKERFFSFFPRVFNTTLKNLLFANLLFEYVLFFPVVVVSRQSVDCSLL